MSCSDSKHLGSAGMESIHTMFPPKDSGKEESGRHFVLVHGACHGAWCWYKLSDILLKAGHRVTAIDLGGSGIDPMDADHISSFSLYNLPLTQFFASLPPHHHKVISVGHSFGGFNLTYSMEQFPDKIAVSVFVAAYMPSSGTFVSFAQSLEKFRQQNGSLEDTEINYGRGPGNPPTSGKFGIQFCRKYLYQNSPSQDITLAGTLLRSSPFLEERISYTKERYGKIARVYVVTEEDRAIPEESQRAMIAENPPDGVYDIKGSDHGAFFSNPYLLAHILVEIANIYGP